MKFLTRQTGPEQKPPIETATIVQATAPATINATDIVSSSNTVSVAQNLSAAPAKGAPSDTKVRRSNKSSERIPKLLILSVQHGSLVECSMENKSKTIKFKFDISDVNPIDVANDLVRTLNMPYVYLHLELMGVDFEFSRFRKIYCPLANGIFSLIWSVTLCVS